MKETSNSLEVADKYKRLYRSPRYYSELLLKIKTKEAQIAPLFFNRSQVYAYKLIQKMRRNHKPIRIIFLKARQLGISTFTSSMIFHHSATRSNVTSFISSHDLDSSENIYQIYKLFYERMDEYFRPMNRYSNRKEILFENPDDKTRKKHPGLNSRIIVQTAKNTHLGRSYTIHNFHGSELAFWQNPEDTMMGVRQAVPEMPGTMIILESTANGIGNYFHRECERALKGKSDYKLIFIPWFWEPKYSDNDLNGFGSLCASEKDEYGDEMSLMKEFGVSRSQLQWRRRKIDNDFEGNIDGFRQEYPSTPREAFIFSGQPVFNAKVLLSMKDHCQKPESIGEITWDSNAKYGLLESHKGSLKIWKNSKPGLHYAIGADVAEGLEGGDNSVVEVFEVVNREQVAEWCGIIAPDDFAHIVLYLALRYNRPLVGVEVNNHGLTTVVGIQQLKYWNQYRRITFDTQKKKRRDSLGWKTTSTTKPLIIDGLRRAIREGEVLVNSEDLIDECLNYVLHEDGSMGASSGKKDDRVMASAIALEMAKQTYIRSGLSRADDVKPFTFDFFDRMADRINQEAKRPSKMGSWHGNIND